MVIINARTKAKLEIMTKRERERDNFENEHFENFRNEKPLMI